MSHFSNEGRQMSLDFNATPAPEPSVVVSTESKVVSMRAFVRSRPAADKSSSVLGRLLKEAQKLRW